VALINQQQVRLPAANPVHMEKKKLQPAVKALHREVHLAARSRIKNLGVPLYQVSRRSSDLVEKDCD